MKAFCCFRLLLRCDGTRAETRFCLSAKRTSPFKPAGLSVQSNTGSRGVGISRSNSGYTMFRVSEGDWLPSFPFTSHPVRLVCHHVSTGVCHHLNGLLCQVTLIEKVNLLNSNRKERQQAFRRKFPCSGTTKYFLNRLNVEKDLLS